MMQEIKQPQYDFLKGRSLDIRALKWKVMENAGKPSINPERKQILIEGPSWDNDKLAKEVGEAIIVNANSNIGGMFELHEGKYRIKPGFEEVYNQFNSQWRFCTVDETLILMNNVDAVVTYPSIHREKLNDMIGRSDFISVQEIKYSWFVDVSEPALQSDGIILIPEPSATMDLIIRPIIESHTPSELRVVMCTLKNDDGYVEKGCDRYIFKLADDKIIVTKETHLYSQWMNEIKSQHDFYKNPNNKKAWQYLFDVEKPHYESEKLFVTSNKNIYVNTNLGWIMLEYDWFKANAYQFPEILNEYNMYKNVQSLS